MKKILVPTDFSQDAVHAYRFAHQMAKMGGAEMILFNVIEFPTGTSFNSMGLSNNDPMENVYVVRMTEATKEKMETLVNDPEYKDVTASYEIVVGNPFIEISEMVAKHDVDVIIMGTHGSSGLEELLVGSNAEKVVRHSKCPVITLRGEADATSVKNIVFASDFTEFHDELIDRIKTLQSFFNATLHLVKVNTPNNFTTTRHDQKQIQEYIDKYGLTNCKTAVYNDVVEEDGIIDYAQDVGAEMIALGTHGRTGIRHAIIGSVAEDVVNRARRPVWTFNVKGK